MYSVTQISSDLFYLLLAFAGIDYTDNSSIFRAQKSSQEMPIAMQIDIEANSRKFSTKFSASGLPQCNKVSPVKATRFKKWRLSITP